MGKPEPAAAADKVALYDNLVDSVSGIERKGAKCPYTSQNGHMFSFLTEDGQLALRLPQEEREAFLKKHNTKLCVVYNTVMKEYVLVPHSMLARTPTVRKHFLISVDYVRSLKPRPTTKPKKKAGTKGAAKKKNAKKSTGKAAAKKKKTSKVRKHR